MTENTHHPKPAGEHKLLRWVLVLQIVILAWLAKNHFDGAFNRGSHTDTPAVATVPNTPPSLESNVPNAPSFFSDPFTSSLQSSRSRRLSHPAHRMRAEMAQMRSQANRAFADFDSVFGADAAWASLPASPTMNMREEDDAYELSLTLPDADPDSLEFRLEGRILTIASRQATRTAGSASSRQFSTRLMLPGPVDESTPLDITNDNHRIRIRIAKPAAVPAAPNP
jgi:HSP20 family molecular chaperone IbpA